MQNWQFNTGGYSRKPQKIYTHTFSFPKSNLKLTVNDFNCAPTLLLTKNRQFFSLTEPEIYDIVEGFGDIEKHIKICHAKIKETGSVRYVTPMEEREVEQIKPSAHSQNYFSKVGQNEKEDIDKQMEELKNKKKAIEEREAAKNKKKAAKKRKITPLLPTQDDEVLEEEETP
jgi:hypothetical protein